VIYDHTFEAESQVIIKLANILARHILPLYAETPNGRIELVGSSFLISSGDNSYLVSAAHVFDELKLGHELFFLHRAGHQAKAFWLYTPYENTRRKK